MLKKADLYNGSIDNEQIYTDNNGNPNGILCEDAQKIILDAAPETTVADVKTYILAASKKYLEYGLTFVQSDDRGLSLRYNLQLRLSY